MENSICFVVFIFESFPNRPLYNLVLVVFGWLRCDGGCFDASRVVMVYSCTDRVLYTCTDSPRPDRELAATAVIFSPVFW